MDKVSIIYPTCRKNPRVDWLFDALWHTQTSQDFDHQLIIVDDYAEDEGRIEEFLEANAGRFPYEHVLPKPCVWRGKHRLTGKNHFAAGNARNTGVCYAKNPHLVFIDDNGVPWKKWLSSHVFAAEGQYITAGPRNTALFDVEKGVPINITLLDNDSRGTKSKDINNNMGENHLFQEIHSNNFSVPLETFLAVNGFDEMYDGQYGVEDCDLSIRMCRTGVIAFYDPACSTLEHKKRGPYMETKDGSKMHAKRKLCNGLVDGQGRPRHANESLILNTDGKTPSLANDKNRITPLGNFFDLRELRETILNGGSFPIPTEPSHDWRDGQPLSEMKD